MYHRIGKLYVFFNHLFSVLIEVLTSSFFKVLKARSLILLCFPKCLNLFGISAFDLFKIVDSCLSVSHAIAIPQSLKLHLKHVKDAILLRHAWVRTSPLVGLISCEAKKESWSYFMDSFRPGSVFDTTGDSCDKTLFAFCGDFITLVQGRIQRIGHILEALLFNHPSHKEGLLIEQVFETFCECLRSHHGIFIGRSAIQVVVCCFYAVCKVSRFNIYRYSRNSESFYIFSDLRFMVLGRAHAASKR